MSSHTPPVVDNVGVMVLVLAREYYFLLNSQILYDVSISL